MRTAYLLAYDQDEAQQMREQLQEAIHPFDRYVFVDDLDSSRGNTPSPSDVVYLSPKFAGRTDSFMVWNVLWDGAVGCDRYKHTRDFRWHYGDLPDLTVPTAVETWLAS